MILLVVTLVLQPGPAARDLQAMVHPARAARAAAIARVAGSDASTGSLAALFDHAESRLARSAMRAVALRKDRSALPALAATIHHHDVARAGEAARSAVAIAFATDAALDELVVKSRRRLQRAVDAAVEARLRAIQGFGHTDKTGQYRPLLAGGAYSGRALRRVARDPAFTELTREHALFALALLEGAAAEPVWIEELDSPAPRVRVSACTLLYEYGSDEGRRRLARRLDSDRLLLPMERAWIVAAVERTRLLTDAGAQKLARRVRTGVLNRALGAAAALKRTRPAMLGPALRHRVLRLLANEAQRAGTGVEVALFQFRVGPLEDDLLARMRRSHNPLLQAAATNDRGQALALIADAIAPRSRAGRSEVMRVRVLYQLLIRDDAPDRERVRFARGALESQVVSSRRYALRVLEGVDPEPLAPFLKTLRWLLRDDYESVRLAAAQQLAPDPEALAVAIQALYDGDLGGGRWGARILGRKRPAADPRERRRLARRLMREHGTLTRGKE